MLALARFLVDGGESQQLVPLKMLYFIHYMAFATQTFLPMYFDTQAGFNKIQIGVLLALPCICAILSPPLWGAVADIFRNQKLVHVLCLISAAFFMWAMQYVHSFVLMCVVFFLANFQMQPTFSLLDQVAMQMLERIGGDFGKQRLHGASGYGLGGYAAGVITATFGIAWCFNMVVALSSVSLFLLVKHIPSYDHEHVDIDFVANCKHIAKQRDVLLLFILVVVIGVVNQVIDSFLILYYFNLTGNNSNFAGIVIAMQTLSQIPFFFHANAIHKKFGTAKCIFLGIFAFAVRYSTYSIISNPRLALPIEALHGITFSVVWTAFTNYVYNSSPVGTEGTMIGLLAAVQKGIGGGAGTLIGGWIYETYGARAMWATGLLVVLPLAFVLTVVFSFVAKHYHDKPSTVELDEMVPLVPLTPTLSGVSPRSAHQYKELPDRKVAEKA